MHWIFAHILRLIVCERTVLMTVLKSILSNVYNRRERWHRAEDRKIRIFTF